MDSVLEKLGAREIINAAGTMTYLGSSPIHPEVKKEINKIADKWVEVERLQERAGGKISEITGSESGLAAASAAAGITLSTAACMTGKNIVKIRALPDTENLNKDVVLIQRGHLVDYGASIDNAIKLAGAGLCEIGNVNKTSPEEMKKNLEQNSTITAALYVVSHHTSQYGSIDFNQFAQIANENKVPVIVDAAAEYNFSEYIQLGADLVICSGHKFLYGPTSGLIAGRENLVEAIKKQKYGIGRSMKTSKEAVVGLIAALNVWQKRDLQNELKEMEKKANYFINKAENIEGLKLSKVKDVTGNPILRVEVYFKDDFGISAEKASQKLKNCGQPIFVRDYHTEQNYFKLDLRFVDENELDYIYKALKKIKYS